MSESGPEGDGTDDRPSLVENQDHNNRGGGRSRSKIASYRHSKVGIGMRRSKILKFAQNDSDGNSVHVQAPSLKPLEVLRHAVHATMFLNRISKSMGTTSTEVAKMITIEEKIGSLSNFIDTKKLGDIDNIIETIPQFLTNQALSNEAGIPSPQLLPAPGPEPPLLPRGQRRFVCRVGDKVSTVRTACPRQQQLRELLPAIPGSTRPMAPSSCSNSPRTPRRQGDNMAAPGTSIGLGRSQDLHSGAEISPALHGRHAPQTNFTAAFIGGLKAKPRAEQHPLLTAMEHGDGDDVHLELEGEIEQATLAQHLEQLRSGQKGAQGTPRSDRRKLQKEDSAPLSARRPLGPRGVSVELPIDTPGPTGTSSITNDWQRLVKMLDAENVGVVSPEMLIPLMFWLGLTRRRNAALAMIEVAFGPGDISTNAILELTEYIEVQLRLVEGLRRLARRESLEQLCEFMTDSDRLRLRTWFYSMKIDTDGHVDIVDVQNLFARMEVTSDRQVLFRFLSYVARNRSTVPTHNAIVVSMSTDRKRGPRQRKLGVDDFSSLICRCIITWCFQRTIMLINSPAAASSVFGDICMDRNSAFRWTQLQRKIVVSLLVNHSFWGRESRQVLMNLKPPAMAQIIDELSPEQWLSLFQRVRAQGIASTLPVGKETEDPGFLRKKVEHDSIVGAA